MSDRPRAVAGRGDAAPPAEIVIGVDVGTTATKVTAFGVGSRWRHTVVREYPLLHPQDGWEIQQPEVILAAALGAIAESVSRGGASRVIAVSLSAAMHGLIGLDTDLRPLTPLLTWADSRATDIARRLRAEGLAAELHHRSGTPVHPMSPLTKLIWFAEHEPELSGRVRAWVGLKDWIVQALTGTQATELSSASGTGLLDLNTRSWSPETLAMVGVSAEQLPIILPTTAALGLTRAVAPRVGLPTATPVVLGAGDGPSGNLGTGALRPGVAGLSIGTSGAVRTVVPEPYVDPGGRLFCYALTDDAWTIGGAISNGGATQRWAGEVFGRPDSGADSSTDEQTLALAATVPAGSDGLLALPFLMAERAPLWDPTVAGAFLGVRSRHTRGHFVRAAVEGVALQLSVIVDELDAVHPIDSVRATGGVFRSDLWRTVLAGVLDRPIVVADGAEGSARGAAALGLIGIGRAASFDSALALLPGPDTGTDRLTNPDPALADTYRRVRADFPRLLSDLGRVAELFRPAAPVPARSG
ncbi:gluconokinase [Nakamurella lactea]|uniref:gluconokinase n=1 Tax=Nakamurella lactea TaxID=459515 RepID=UPI000410BF54|nr:gluconokinase [Nakamurella lactea]